MNPRLYTLLVIAGFACAVFIASTAQSHGETDYFQRVAQEHRK